VTSHLAYLVLGLGAGAALSLLACGVVITDRASGVVNFAHAAMGMYLAHVFYEFRETGDLVLPIVGLPARVHLLARPTVAAALAIVVLYAAIIGAATYVMIFRRLATAPPLGRVVASIGLFLYLWAMVGLRFPNPPRVRRILPSGAVDVFGQAVFVDRLWAALIAAVVTAALWATYRFTRFGLATTAAAESPKGALLTGLPVQRLALANWVIATVLAALAVIIIAPVNQLDPLSLSLLIVPALAAVLLGGSRSFGWVSLSAFAIGMAQSEIVNLQVSWPSVSGLGLQQGLPFVVILVTLAVRGHGLPERGATTVGRLPASPEPSHVVPTAVALAAIAAFVMAVGGSDWRAALITSCIATIMSLSVVVLTGYVGQISLAPFAFAGVAAFSLAKLSAWDVPFPLAPVIAVAATVALGIAVGIPASRVRGLNLAITTLGAAVAIEQLLFKWRPFVAAGSDGPARPGIGGLDLGISARGSGYPRVAFGLFAIVVATVAAMAVANLRRGPTGLAWLAMRGNERAAAAAGVDVTRAKLAAFAVSAGLAGVGGVMLTYQRGTLSADGFAVFLSLATLAMTYLGGISSVTGAVIAGAIAPLGVLTVLSGQDMTAVSPYAFVINGALLIGAALLYPDGLAGALATGSRRLRSNSRRRLSGLRPTG